MSRKNRKHKSKGRAPEEYHCLKCDGYFSRALGKGEVTDEELMEWALSRYAQNNEQPTGRCVYPECQALVYESDKVPGNSPSSSTSSSAGRIKRTDRDAYFAAIESGLVGRLEQVVIDHLLSSGAEGRAPWEVKFESSEKHENITPRFATLEYRGEIRRKLNANDIEVVRINPVTGNDGVVYTYCVQLHAHRCDPILKPFFEKIFHAIETHDYACEVEQRTKDAIIAELKPLYKFVEKEWGEDFPIAKGAGAASP